MSPRDWTQATIADIASDDGLAIGPFGSSLKADSYEVAGMPVVRGQDIVDGKRLADRERVFVSHSVAAKFPRCLVRKDDLVFPHRGAIGRVGIVGDETLLLSTSMMKLTVNRAIVDPTFVFYYFRGPGKQFLLSRASTVGTPGIAQPLASLRSIPISCPPLKAQRAIAEVLGALDDKIAANQELLVLADELAGVNLSEACDGRVVPLSQIASVVMGSSPPGSSYNEFGEGVAFHQGVKDFGLRSPKRRVWTTSPIRMAEANDTLVSVRAPVGRLNLNREPICIGRGLASVRSTQGAPMTLFHRMRSATDAWAPFEAEGTVFGAINRAQLEAIQVPAIRAEMAESLERRMAAHERYLAAVERESLNLAHTRDEFLPLLMSGKITVRDAERTVSDLT